MIAGQEMEIALGLPVIVENFKDGVPRVCYPFTLSNLTMANFYLSNFNHSDIYQNFMDETGSKVTAMKLFFQEAFRPQNEDELMSLLKAIDNDNFAEIVGDIKRISGIKDVDEDDASKMFQGANGEKVSWETMVNIIPLYTSTPLGEVKNMTLPQFNRTLELIQKKNNWDYKLATIPLSKEPNKHIDKKDEMFYEEPKKGNQKVTTMKEIMGMM